MDVDEYLNLNPNIKIINQSSSSLLENEKPDEELEEIKNRGNYLLRQELKDKTPINTPNCIIFNHIIFIFFFFVIASLILITNIKKNFIEVEYTSCNLNTKCEIEFNIDNDINPPIFVYYKLENFYSNHIDYVKSKNYMQLRGKKVSDKKIDFSCKSMSRNRDHFIDVSEDEILSYKSKIMPKDSIMNPCGLIANSIFTDEFELYNLDDKNTIKIDQKEIALAIDIEKIFKNNKNSENIQWFDKENEHFMVWMNMELFPNFIKKWGHINKNLPKGKYKIIIDNKWGKAKWGVKKYFVLAKGNIFGSEIFFGCILVICCGIEFIFIIIIYIRKYKKKKI